MFYSVDLLSPKGALGQIWVRRTRTTRLAPAPSARFPLSSSVPVLHPPSTERLTRPPRRAFADPGAPAEPRGSPEPAQIRQALRGGRVRHHHEAPLSAGTSSRARRKRVSDTTPETSRGSPRARTRRRALTCRIRGGAPTTRIVAGTSTRRAADARGRDPVLPPGTRAARSPAASPSFSREVEVLLFLRRRLFFSFAPSRPQTPSFSPFVRTRYPVRNKNSCTSCSRTALRSAHASPGTRSPRVTATPCATTRGLRRLRAAAPSAPRATAFRETCRAARTAASP